MHLPDELSTRYEVKGLLGKGGMGQVFLARERELDREVALKLVSPSPNQDGVRHKRFEREGQIAAALRHPGIVRVHDYG